MKITAYETFLARVRKRMNQQDINITTLAEKLGVPRPGISRVLNGKEVPSLNRAELFAEALDTTLPKLLK